MKATETLHERGQSLWLDNITRSMLDDGTIQRYIDAYSVTGLTSNPSIYDKAIGSGDYDDAIRSKSGAGLSPEELFFELAIEDLRRAADLFLPIHQRTNGVDGWVSLEVSPLLAYQTADTVAAAKTRHEQAGRPNLFIKIPGTRECLPAITEAIAAGIPVNVTLLFSADQYRAAADAYLQGIERRVADGLNPNVGSVASVFMSRWDQAVADRVPADLHDQLALAVGLDVYRAYRQLTNSDRVQRLKNDGARMQRLLWASTSTKDPAAPDTLYVHGLAAPFTVNTMPENTLKAFYDHGEVGDPLPADGGDADALLARFTDAGVDLGQVAAQLQRDGAASFVTAWNELMDRIQTQTSAVA
ncbi:transaldolase [Mycobacterium talmoniae]|uniref:Transaldolase n=1 Tax=Mycobacterium talmoniae TaxID=1858794 RepID=A0A1S1NEU7_9MYCO|nr:MULTISPECIES: transaldolase [Mycobacterium]OHU99224.1 transaldolase [Mycobacterium talmoniae]PQM44995.1 Transaldolase [Mycobacterium talmoniae]TDH57233.1 transaldolase [Mycobacterium eburneum]